MSLRNIKMTLSTGLNVQFEYPWVKLKVLIFGSVESESWQYRLWSFLSGGTKLDRFLHENQHTQRKLLNLVSGEVPKNVKILFIEC